MILAADVSEGQIVLSSVVLFLCVGLSAYVGLPPLRRIMLAREAKYGEILQGRLLMDIQPRMVTVLTGIVAGMLALCAYVLTDSLIGAALGLAGGVFLPTLVLKLLREQRLRKIEAQLLTGIAMLSSGVRAGLNMVQAMEMLAREGPTPLRQEFAHLVREYEYGLPLEDAMNNAVARIGSGDFALLVAAMMTHRERGGNLGETLDRISASLREIQRLDARVKTLTAQGRANARFLSILVLLVLVILFAFDSDSMGMVLKDDIGKLILGGIALLMGLGFLWIRKIVDIDI
jgi:tight adherence protein B